MERDVFQLERSAESQRSAPLRRPGNGDLGKNILSIINCQGKGEGKFGVFEGQA